MAATVRILRYEALIWVLALVMSALNLRQSSAVEISQYPMLPNLDGFVQTVDVAHPPTTTARPATYMDPYLADLYDKCGCYDTHCMLALIPKLPGHECVRMSEEESPHAGRYWMVTKCPQAPGEVDEDLRMRCENPNWNELSTITPVYANTTGMVYRNVHCVTCHESGYLNFWHITVTSNDTTVYNHQADLGETWKNIRQNEHIGVSFRFEPPDAYANKTYTCNDTGFLISNCLMPGLDPDDELGCSNTSAISPVVGLVDGDLVIYRNPHCYACSVPEVERKSVDDIVCYKDTPYGFFRNERHLGAEKFVLNPDFAQYSCSADLQFDEEQDMCVTASAVATTTTTTTDHDDLVAFLAVPIDILVRGGMYGNISNDAVDWYIAEFIPPLTGHLLMNGASWVGDVRLSVSDTDNFRNATTGTLICVLVHAEANIPIKLVSEDMLWQVNITSWNVMRYRINVQDDDVLYTNNAAKEDIASCVDVVDDDDNADNDDDDDDDDDDKEIEISHSIF